ncbi:MAG: hypothetical protein QM753_21005 [Thermomicrobiales bacterium]
MKMHSGAIAYNLYQDESKAGEILELNREELKSQAILAGRCGFDCRSNHNDLRSKVDQRDVVFPLSPETLDTPNESRHAALTLELPFVNVSV